ncbi:hypothetical protein C9928_06600, partial [Pseudidiomarina aestuarii]
DRITFLGWIYYEQKLELLKSCHIFCLPSRYDSFGMGYVEAMSAGMPVVALHREAIPDVVKHGETGILTHDAEPSSLAEAITHCYQHREKLGTAAKQHVLESFDADAIVNHLIHDVLGSATSQ